LDDKILSHHRTLFNKIKTSFRKRRQKPHLKLLFRKKKQKIGKLSLFIGIYWRPAIHKSALTLRNFFASQKTTCSYSSLLQVFARVEQQIKTPFRCTPLRPSFHSGEIFYFVKNSRAFRNFSSSDFVEGKISPPRAFQVS
jgi:hypothetical protein